MCDPDNVKDNRKNSVKSSSGSSSSSKKQVVENGVSEGRSESSALRATTSRADTTAAVIQVSETNTGTKGSLSSSVSPSLRNPVPTVDSSVSQSTNTDSVNMDHRDEPAYNAQSLNVSSISMTSNDSGRSLSALAPLRLTRSIQNSSWRENLSNYISSGIQEFRPVFHAHNIANLSNYRISSSSNFRHIDSPTSDSNQYPSDTFVINLDNATHASNNNVVGGPEYQSTGRPSLSEVSLRNEPQHNAEPDNGPHNARSDNEDSGGEADASHDADLSETLAQIPEAAHLLNTLAKYVPYLCILLAKSCYDHLDGILDFFVLFITFYHANRTVREEVTKQNQRSILPLLRELLYIVVVVALVAFLLESNNIPLSLLLAIPFNLTSPFTLKSLMFAIGINDLILKLVTVAIKIIFTLLPPSLVDYKGRGRIYLMIESISQLYRALVTTHPWLLFLLDSYEGTEKIMGVILSGAYIVAKGTDLLQRIKFVKHAFIKLLQKVNFGTIPTKEQIQEAGGVCTICHDNFNSPVMLGKCQLFEDFSFLRN